MTNADAFWDAVIAPHLARAQPGLVLLVGGGDGAIIGKLLGALADRATLHVADAAPDYDPAAIRQQAGDRVVFHRADPVQVIGLLPVPALLLLDPDPNWYTVQRLLLAADGQAARLARPFPVTLLCQTGWPHGRRDGYRNPGAIPDALRHPHEQAGLRPGVAGLSSGSGLFTGETHAVAENVAQSGVLTALEDVVAGAMPRLAFRSLPFRHGLSVVYPAASAREPGLRELLDGLAMGEAAGRLGAAVETDRCAAAAEAEDLRRALASERYRNTLLHDNLRLARAGAARPAGAIPQEAAAPQAPAPGMGARARRKLRRAAQLAAWAAKGQVTTRRAAEAAARDIAADIARLRQSPVLDAAWYARTYHDVAETGADAAAHYYHFGAAEGRDPGPHFSTAYYLAHGADVADSGINPLLHYLADGGREGRDPGPDFSSRYYLETQTDVAESGINPLEHFLACGAAEGRLPRDPW
jgi:hypothetical protein